MKKILFAIMLALMPACQSATEHGECVGIIEEEDPSLKYEASVRNIVLAVIFIETIFVPLVVLLGEVKCPVEKK
jgi:hypothetical protein